MDVSLLSTHASQYIKSHFPDFGWAVLVAILLYWFGSKIVKWLTIRISTTTYQRTTQTKKDIEKRQATLVALFVTFWRILVITFLIFAALRIFFRDIDLAPLFASAGVIGVALGVGAQSLIKDFLSGIFIISENQYRVGDVVDIEGASGTVERIGVRSTVLRDVEGNVHFFPNGMVQHVINKTMGYSMSRFTIAVTPDTDIDSAATLIDKIGTTLAKEEAWKLKIIEPPQFVMVGEITSTAVNLIISGKTQPSEQWSVTAEMRRRLLEEFEKKGIRLGTTHTVVAGAQKKKG